jgi:hypothetical protein
VLFCRVYIERYPRRFVSSLRRDLRGLSVSARDYAFFSASPNPQLSTFNSQPLSAPKSFPLISFTDPHPITILKSYRFKKVWGQASSYFTSYPLRSSSLTPLSATLMNHPVNGASKRLTPKPKPFRCNTYKKQGVTSFKPKISLFPCVVVWHSSPIHTYRPSCDEISVTATPLFPALTNCDVRNSFGIRSYEKCRVSFSPSPVFSLFSQEMFHIPFTFKSFRFAQREHRKYDRERPFACLRAGLWPRQRRSFQ